jgi:uncharacterized protein
MTENVFVKKTWVDEPVETVFSWHERPGAIERLSPPWDNIRLKSQSNGIRPGSEVRLTIAPLGPFRMNWTARHTKYEKNRCFQDIQEKGPFSRWVHTHRFTPDGKKACFIEDRVEYALPFHRASAVMFDNILQHRLERIFTYRHDTIAADLADHRKYGLKPMNILVSGSHGLIASALIPFLSTGGHRVFRLVRTPPGPGDTDCVYCDAVNNVIDINHIKNIDAVIHLAGESISSGRWSARKKQRIMESRTESTALLAKTLAGLENPPKVFACASAIGYYGNQGDKLLLESDAAGDDFISMVCEKWEASSAPAAAVGIRTVLLRIGIVLTPSGGALQKMLPAFKMGLGGKMGTGDQFMSWIGIDDVVGSILHLVANPDLKGPVNIVAPQPLPNRDFAKTLARVIARPSLINIPSPVIKMVFGQMGKETALSSTRVMPEKLSASGYTFRHSNLDSALSHVLGKMPRGKNRV